jgi:hypothetical protein
MRTILASLLVATFATTLPGCFGCGAYSGSNDKVFARGNDQLILCENGGYVATVSNATLQGFYTENAPGSSIAYVGTDGPTSQHSFDLTETAGGQGANIPQFGQAPWELVSLDKTALDHADSLCQGLETQSWWTTPQ